MYMHVSTRYSIMNLTHEIAILEWFAWGFLAGFIVLVVVASICVAIQLLSGNSV